MVKHSESKPPLRFSWLYAPVLAAIYPVLRLYADSVREANPGDAAICGVVAVVAAITLAYLLRLVYSDAKRAGLAAVVIIVWCFTFSGYVRFGRMGTEMASSSSSSSPLNDLFLILVWLMLLFVALWFLFRVQWSEFRIGRVYRFVKLACLFAVIFAVYQTVPSACKRRMLTPLLQFGPAIAKHFQKLGDRALPIIPATSTTWSSTAMVTMRHYGVSSNSTIRSFTTNSKNEALSSIARQSPVTR